MEYKEIVVGTIIALLVVAGFTFRERIFRRIPDNMPRDNLGTAQPTSPEATSSPADRAQRQDHVSTTVGSVVIYRGRRLDEIQFSSGWLQSASTQQKNQMSLNIEKYAKMAKDNPEHIAAWLQVAILKKAIGDYEGARDIWLYVTAARPHEATAFFNLGDLYTNYLKDYASAEKNYQNAIKAEPKNAMGYLGLSELYVFFYKEKAAQAEQILKQGIAANPGDVNLQKALARLYERNAK